MIFVLQLWSLPIIPNVRVVYVSIYNVCDELIELILHRNVDRGVWLLLFLSPDEAFIKLQILVGKIKSLCPSRLNLPIGESASGKYNEFNLLIVR